MKKCFIFLLLICFITACKSITSNANLSNLNYSASVYKKGFIDCFEPTWDSLKNKWTFCELSAAVAYNNKLLVASDKAIPNHSSAFQLEIEKNDIKHSRSTTYLDENLIKNARKFEDFSISPDQRYIFLTTAFDRLKPNDWDGYNCLLYWPISEVNKVQLLAASERNSTKSSIDLRVKIKKALIDNNYPNGPDYFKIEGLAAIPGQNLIFGLREIGDRYDNFQYKIKLLSIGYKITSSGEIELEDQVKSIYEFNPKKSDYPNLQFPIAISSIEYDLYNDWFYLTTSFEHDKKLGAYLWILNPTELKSGAPPKLIKNSKGEIFEMDHKAEAVSVINKNKIIIIHDDDRELIDSRKPHQSAYQIINIQRH